MTKPEWQDWPEEPWGDFTKIVPAKGAVEEYADLRLPVPAWARARASVNALAGIRNPASVGEVIEAAREIPEHSGAHDSDCLDDVPGVRLSRALANLDKEPGK